nr:transposase, Ptta/En/Spm, transposase, Tnp1/En/Spm-like protein [Tanacetum cinerariifolium]
EIVKAKVKRKSIALKAKKESSDEECSTSSSEDKEYTMAVRDFKKFFKRIVKESLNVIFDETPPPSKTPPLVDDDLDEEEEIKVIKKKNLENDIVDETLEIEEIVNIKESRNHPLENVIGNLNQRTLSFSSKDKKHIEEDENKALQKLNKTLAERAAKRRKLDEEAEELRRHLQIVPNEDDDVYTESTPLARKVPVVDYQTRRNEHGPAKVKGWKLLESCGVQIITFTSTQLILLVERKYPLTRFTLEQMLNVVRLEVEEESEVSLELLRFIRQQHQEGQHE